MNIAIRHNSPALEKQKAWAQIKQKSPDLQKFLGEIVKAFGQTKTVNVAWK